MTQLDLPVRAATDDDFGAIAEMLSAAFAEPPSDEENARLRPVFEASRCLVATDGGRVIANAGAYTRGLTVPGQLGVPAAHVTLVAVEPTYRRRGLLRRLMGRQLRELHAGGVEPIAVLWASEGGIYQRFGYGLAASRLSLEIDTREARLPDPPTRHAGHAARRAGHRRPRGPGRRVRTGATHPAGLVDPGRALVGLRPGRPAQPPERPHATAGAAGGRRRRAAGVRPVADEEQLVADRTGRCGHRAGTGGAATPEAYTALWRFLLTVDLTRSARHWNVAVDEPLIQLVNEVKALGARVSDALWVRVVDLPAALTARRYATGVDVVLDVTDPLLTENTGRWRLRTTGDAPTCTRTGEPPALSCSVADLGAAYLGGTSLSSLAAPGRVREHRPGAAARTDAAFRSPRAPSAIDVF